MSKAKELASDCGLCDIDPSGRAITDYGDHTEELMAFYHAVRAEAMRDAAELCYREYGTSGDAGDKLRAMADREGKE